jgi:hypothetical protein
MPGEGQSRRQAPHPRRPRGVEQLAIVACYRGIVTAMPTSELVGGLAATLAALLLFGQALLVGHLIADSQ